MKRASCKLLSVFLIIMILFSIGGCSSDKDDITTLSTLATQSVQTEQTQGSSAATVEATTPVTATTDAPTTTVDTQAAAETTPTTTQSSQGGDPSREDKAIQWVEPALEALVREKLAKPDGAIMQSELDDIWGIELIGSTHIYFNGDGGYSMYTNPDTSFAGGAGAAQLQNPAGIYFEADDAQNYLKEGTYVVKGETFSRGAIRSLADFSNFRNVKFLFIYKNNLNDLTGLESLENLTALTLIENAIVDISTLAKLEKVERLVLTANEITDVSPLSSLNQLVILGLQNNKINSVQGFASLSNLEQLLLSFNPIENLEVVKSLPRLSRLLISNTRVNDISALDGNTSLEHLFMDNLDIKHIDLEPLAAVPNLTVLMVNQNTAELINIRAIGELKKLRFLVILQGEQSANIPDEEIDWLHEQLPGCVIDVRSEPVS